MEVQAGYYDSDDPNTCQDDIGIIMQRKMDRIRLAVAERRKKIINLLEANTAVKYICNQLGCSETSDTLVYKIQSSHNGGKAAEINFTRKQISQPLDAKEGLS